MDPERRQGYFATPTAVPAPANRAEAMFAALSSPLDTSVLGLTARMAPASGGAGGATITIRLDPDGVTLQGEGNQWDGRVAIAIAGGAPGRPAVRQSEHRRAASLRRGHAGAAAR